MNGPEEENDAPELSESEIEDLEKAVQSAPAPPTATVVSTSSPVLATIFTKGLQAVFKQPNTPRDIIAALDDMALPKPLFDELSPLFSKAEFELANASIVDPDNETKSRPYTAVKRGGAEVAILHLPSWVLQTSDSTLIVGGIIRIFSNRDGRIISSGVDRAVIGFRRTLESISSREGQSWKFIPWGDIDEALKSQISIDKALDIALAHGPEVVSNSDPKLEGADSDFVSGMLVDHATGSGLAVSKFFSDLVKQLDLPQGFQNELNNAFDNNAATNTRTVLSYLASKGRYGAASDKKGDYFIGRLLLNRLDFVGLEGEKELAKIIDRRKLLTHPDDLQRIKKILEV